MNEHSTEKLLEIVNSPNTYRKEILDEAEKELLIRKVPYKRKEAERPSMVFMASAGLIPRFLESIIDGIMIGLIYVMFVSMLFVVEYLLIPKTIIEDTTFKFIIYHIMELVVPIFVIILYYVIFESSYGKTIGKMICGLKVVDVQGKQPTSKMIFRRTLCRFIPFDRFSFGATSKHNRYAFWHDKISETFVISTKKLYNLQNKSKSVSENMV